MNREQEINDIIKELVVSIVKLELHGYFTGSILVSLLTISRWYSQTLLTSKVLTDKELKKIALNIDNKIQNMPKEIFKTR